MYGNAVVIYTLTSLQTRSQHLTIMLSLACSDMITSSEFFHTYTINTAFILHLDCTILIYYTQLSSSTLIPPILHLYCT